MCLPACSCCLVCSLAKCVCLCVFPQAMKMSRRSADASQRAQAYSRMVDGLNEFRSVLVWCCCSSLQQLQQVDMITGPIVHC